MIVLAFLYYEQKIFLCICFLNDCLLLAINLFFLRYKIKWLLLVTFHLNESPFWWTFPFKWTFVNASQHVNRLQSAASKKKCIWKILFISVSINATQMKTLNIGKAKVLETCVIHIIWSVCFWHGHFIHLKKWSKWEKVVSSRDNNPWNKFYDLHWGLICHNKLLPLKGA